MSRHLVNIIGVIGTTMLSAMQLSAQLATARAWRLEPVATIEGLTSDDPFGAIRGLAMHRDGRVAVTESNPRRVSVFDGQGRSLGMVGRIGGGPGEYREPYSAAWLADTLAIYDPGESRVLYMTNGRTPLRTERTARYTGPDIRFHPVSRTKAFLPMPRIDGTRIAMVFVGFGESAVRDTITIPPQPPATASVACQLSNGGIRFFTSQYASKSLAFPVSPNGALAVGTSAKYHLGVLLKGKALSTIARPDFTLRPLTNAEWRFANPEYEKHVLQYGAASCSSAPVRPSHVTPIVATAVADNGDIWVMVRGTGGYAFNVFANNGRLRGVMDVPRGIRAEIPIAVAGDHIAWVSHDRDDIPLVHVARVIR